MAKRRSIGGKTWIISGIILTAASLSLNLSSGSSKFSLFLVFGIGLIAFGFGKIFMVEKQEGEIERIKAEMRGHKKHVPDARPHPHGNAPYHPHHKDHHFHTAKKAHFCARCGNEMGHNDIYCSNCGKKRQ